MNDKNHVAGFRLQGTCNLQQLVNLLNILLTIMLMRLHWLLLWFFHLHLENINQEGKGHCKINIPLRYVEVQALSN